MCLPKVRCVSYWEYNVYLLIVSRVCALTGSTVCVLTGCVLGVELSYRSLDKLICCDLVPF